MRHHEPFFSSVPQVLSFLWQSTSAAFPGPSEERVAASLAEAFLFKAPMTPELRKSVPWGNKTPI